MATSDEDPEVVGHAVHDARTGEDVEVVLTDAGFQRILRAILDEGTDPPAEEKEHTCVYDGRGRCRDCGERWESDAWRDD